MECAALDRTQVTETCRRLSWDDRHSINTDIQTHIHTAWSTFIFFSLLAARQPRLMLAVPCRAVRACKNVACGGRAAYLGSANLCRPVCMYVPLGSSRINRPSQSPVATPPVYQLYGTCCCWRCMRCIMLWIASSVDAEFVFLLLDLPRCTQMLTGNCCSYGSSFIVLHFTSWPCLFRLNSLFISIYNRLLPPPGRVCFPWRLSVCLSVRSQDQIK